ncbi:Methyltransferase domain-containing protein [Maridesulfovibrio ferrireducens]|uniref:Methyltransferase domain-containing protein n=1 Tax=Maridesulfovibrio ferrireducens TaxID=246191 RepID=A0A1G9CMQ8_9BACT|nr:class I SAM-dependent methyltransferase [Maridesulfovibrio ferrireducens]SDK52869.1 Methyltransferase domain-containing protein [Maridesulfovibrio ferrireducens]
MNEKQMLDSVAHNYLNPTTSRDTDKNILDLIAKHVLKNMPSEKDRIIEMGIGDNVWTKYILDKFNKSTIIDASEDLIDAVRPTYKNVEFVNSYFENYSPENKYDQVVCSFVLEHVIDPVETLQKVRTWIHDESVVHILVPNADSIHRQHAVKMNLAENSFDLGPADKKIHHRRVYTLEHLRGDIEKAGLKVVSEEGLFLKTLPNSFLSQLSPEQLKGFFDLAFDFPVKNGAALYLTAKK